MRALVALGLLAAMASVATAGAARSSVLVIRLKSVETSSRIVRNEPPSRLSKGDVVAERDNLFNVARQLGKPAGALVGTDKATITFVSEAKATVAGSTSFPGGTITFRGKVSFTSTRPVSLRIVGGTGRYAHATGTVTEPATDNDPKNARNTYRITLP